MTTTTFRLQRPDSRSDETLLWHLIDACTHAKGGAGMFAYATVSGIDRLFREPVFREFLRLSPFHLIVGLDGITNVAALKGLNQYQTEFAKLEVHAFLNDEPATFHPKLTWFRTPHGGRVIVGSGNLTLGGLGNNWEAFVSVEVNNPRITEITALWEEWLTKHQDKLYSATSEKALERAARNHRPPKGAGGKSEDGAAKAPKVGASVLLAELAGPGRWGQAAFPKWFVDNFFEVRPKTSDRLTLWPLSLSGQEGTKESRLCGYKAGSKNWYFELGQATEKGAYPLPHKPIGIFHRIAPREMRYLILMPDDSDYTTVSTYLRDNKLPRGNELPRAIVSATDLQKAWPDSPLFL